MNRRRDIQPSLIAEIAATLRGLNRDHGLTILVTEQNTGFLSAVAGRVLRLDDGRIAAPPPKSMQEI